MKARPKAVFIDRDGVLIREQDYLGSVDGILVLKGAAQAMKLLRAAGYKLVIVTNQSGVARGYFTMGDVRRIHAELKRRLAKQGARWDAVYVSPDGPESRSPMRKPAPGMLFAAKRRFGLDLKASWLIGDRTTDIECARRGGCRSILVRTGRGGRDAKHKTKPDAVCGNVLVAARRILACAA